eukprot:superscaffoldBa00000046_g802
MVIGRGRRKGKKSGYFSANLQACSMTSANLDKLEKSKIKAISLKLRVGQEGTGSRRGGVLFRSTGLEIEADFTSDVKASQQDQLKVVHLSQQQQGSAAPKAGQRRLYLVLLQGR